MSIPFLQYGIHVGWVRGVEHIHSPNCSHRIQASNISLLVIHNISLPPGEFENTHIKDFFTNQLDISCHPYFEAIHTLRVSSHLLIERSGRVCQFVSLYDKAWHAGASCFNGVADCNDYSIGIELEGTDTLPYTDAQYEGLQALCLAIMAEYPSITPDRVVGHCDIAPERKTDPGAAFDWHRLRSGLK